MISKEDLALYDSMSIEEMHKKAKEAQEYLNTYSDEEISEEVLSECISDITARQKQKERGFNPLKGVLS